MHEPDVGMGAEHIDGKNSTMVAVTSKRRKSVKKSRVLGNPEELNVELYVDVPPQRDGKDDHREHRAQRLLRNKAKREQRGNEEVTCSSAELQDIREQILEAEQHELMLSQQFRDLQNERNPQKQTTLPKQKRSRTRDTNRGRGSNSKQRQVKAGGEHESNDGTETVDGMKQDRTKQEQVLSVRSKVKDKQCHKEDDILEMDDTLGDNIKKTQKQATRRSTRRMRQNKKTDDPSKEQTYANVCKGAIQDIVHNRDAVESSTEAVLLVNKKCNAVEIVAEVHHCNVDDSDHVPDVMEDRSDGAGFVAKSEADGEKTKQVNCETAGLESTTEGTRRREEPFKTGSGRMVAVDTEVSADVGHCGDVGEVRKTENCSFPNVYGHEVHVHIKKSSRPGAQKPVDTLMSDQWHGVRHMAKDLVNKRKKRLTFKKKKGRKRSYVDKKKKGK